MSSSLLQNDERRRSNFCTQSHKYSQIHLEQEAGFQSLGCGACRASNLHGTGNKPGKVGPVPIALVGLWGLRVKHQTLGGADFGA